MTLLDLRISKRETSLSWKPAVKKLFWLFRIFSATWSTVVEYRGKRHFLVKRSELASLSRVASMSVPPCAKFRSPVKEPTI